MIHVHVTDGFAFVTLLNTSATSAGTIVALDPLGYQRQYRRIEHLQVLARRPKHGIWNGSCITSPFRPFKHPTCIGYRKSRHCPWWMNSGVRPASTPWNQVQPPRQAGPANPNHGRFTRRLPPMVHAYIGRGGIKNWPYSSTNSYGNLCQPGSWSHK